ncbi:hypothetical protein CC2G_004217 [Coprinopsis cinerea AmutBmut pab1-1]|nr:hypothetical protein CC2G_004217 [Coprinopsis cinerea AmutBmut pab1-1]
MTTKTQIKLKGEVGWEAIFNYDNTGNTGEIVQTWEVKILRKSVRSSFAQEVSSTTRKTLEESGQSVGTGFSYAGVSASVSSSWEYSQEITEMLENTTSTSSEDTYVYEKIETRSYTIGPGGKLKLFQKYFKAPGMKAQFDRFTTSLEEGEEKQEIDIDVEVEAIEFIKDIKVVYTDNATGAPNLHIREIENGNSDVNAGFGGKYVWLVEDYSMNTEEVMTSVDFVRQSSSDDKYSDLAAGAGGDFRYLIPVYDGKKDDKISELGLLRSKSKVSLEAVKEKGWEGMTTDINADRDGDYLYLLWKTRHAY